MTVPPLHILIYGEPFVGKSYFNRTMPVPHLIFFFDNPGKDNPYLGLGQVQDVNPDGTPMLNSVGCPMKRVWKDDQLLLQIEYFHERYWVADQDGGLVPDPTAYSLFCKRMVAIDADCQYFATISIDSLTFLEIAMRQREQYKLNPTARDPRQWYGGARNEVEQIVMCRFGSLPTNIVLVCHEATKEIEKTKELLRGVNVVGQLGKTIPCAFPEMYRMRFDPLGNKGAGLRYLQTVSDINWPANSEFAPNPCKPDYQSVIASIKE